MIHEPVNGKYYKLQLHILKNEYLNAVNSGICHNLLKMGVAGSLEKVLHIYVIFPKDVANKMEKSKLQNFMSVNLFFLHAAL